jgi:hypothetical protein
VFHVFWEGYCAALPVWQEHESREGCLHHVRLPEDAAHVPYGDARDDQPCSLSRQAMNPYLPYLCLNFEKYFQVLIKLDKIEKPFWMEIKEFQAERTACAEVEGKKIWHI